MKCFAVDGGALAGKLGEANVPRVRDKFFVERAGGDTGARYRLKVTHVPTMMVEEELLRVFERWGARPVVCCVKRALREGQLAYFHDNVSLASLAAELVAEIPLPARLVKATSFFHPVHMHRAGLRLEYDAADAYELAAREWRQRVRSAGAAPARKGQPIQLEVMHLSVLAMPSSVFAGLKAVLDPVTRAAAARGVAVTRLVKGARTVVQLQAASQALLREVKATVDDALRCAVYDGAGKHLLFTRLGKLSLEGLLPPPAFVHCEAGTRIVRVFGPGAAREAALASLALLGLRLLAALVTKSFRVRATCRREVRAALARLGAGEEVEGVRLSGVMLEAVGTQRALEGITRGLEGWLEDVDGGAGGGGDGDEETCPLCFCPADDAYELVACGHVFCRECLEGQFQGAHLQVEAPALPLTCVAEGCGAAVAWGDVVALASPAALSFMKRCAVAAHVLASAGSLRVCPQPGCNQVLSVAQGGAAGAAAGECDQCLRAYCMVCSDREGKPVDKHAGETCQDVVSGGSTDVRHHVDHVLERILTLHCPKCAMAFLDYTGCFALTCSSGTCRANFCACCLNLSSSSADAHAHVRECDKNPHKGEYFGSMAEFTAIHCERRKREVEAYLDLISSGDMRRQGCR
ncbi:hypothetical protein T484DRAFT_2598696 [Baffinella frigidus]|nr:hypothetical protein T484DRAFT_2598696 [Cryptophyta sp. CCMP2293]